MPYIAGAVIVERAGRRPLTLGSLAGSVSGAGGYSPGRADAQQAGSLVLLGAAFTALIAGASNELIPVPTNATSCTAAANCWDCVQLDGCGYCPASEHPAQCVAGNSTEPANPQVCAVGYASAVCPIPADSFNWRVHRRFLLPSGTSP